MKLAAAAGLLQIIGSIGLQRWLPLLLLLNCLSSVAAEKPQRIVSLSLCTDQLLLMLVDKKRIAAMSHLAGDKMYSYMWRQSEGVFQHNNQAEELIALNPDLIISPSYTSGNTQAMLKRLGHNVLTFSPPKTLNEAERYTRAIGDAVQEPERAEAIINDMRNDVKHAKRIVAKLPQQLAISYGPNGYTAGKYTMKNEILTSVGYQNLAARLGIEHFGNVSLEQLVISNPDVIIMDEDIPNHDSLAQQSVKHPVMKHFLNGKRLPNLPISYWICPGPISGKAIRRLAEQRQ